VKDEDLVKLAVRDLEPLLAAKASWGDPTKARRKRGGRDAPGNKMWISIPDGPEVTLVRTLPVTAWEASLLEPYGDALCELSDLKDSIARTAADEVALRAIAYQLGVTEAAAVESAIRFLLKAAVSTYEGQPIHLNLLLDLDLVAERSGASSLQELGQYSWYPVLGNSLETGLLVDKRGAVVRVLDVGSGPMGAKALQTADLRPSALRRLGGWSATGHRIVLSLTRTHELLIHQQGMLRYIYRAARWRSLPLDNALKIGWANGSSLSRDVKKAALASMTDASIGHHGACLAIVAKGQKQRFLSSDTVQSGDMWPEGERAALFAEHSFTALTRRQRLELLSMDGATILDHHGQILAAGAIIQVPAGSPGGGRSAATLALARFGSAFKVSQDGPISLYGIGEAGEPTARMTLA
jgi:hypothetical protein